MGLTGVAGSGALLGQVLSTPQDVLLLGCQHMHVLCQAMSAMLPPSLMQPLLLLLLLAVQHHEVVLLDEHLMGRERRRQCRAQP